MPAERQTMPDFGVEFAWGAATNVGKVRQLNEDSFFVRSGAFVVADGMGGHQAGEVASQLTVESVRSELGDAVPDISELDSLVQHAHDAVRLHSAESGREGMGTTLVGVFLARNGTSSSLVAVNVGDSRCYWLVDGALEQLSTDHSHVQELVDAGEITQEEAARHPERNVVTRAIGIDPTVAADFIVIPEAATARILLCSDGVSGELDSERIRGVLVGCEDPQDSADTLIAAVLEGRAADNATAVVIDVTRISEPGVGEDLDVTGPRPARISVQADESEEVVVAAEVISEVPVAARSVNDDAVSSLIDHVPG